MMIFFITLQPEIILTPEGISGKADYLISNS